MEPTLICKEEKKITENILKFFIVKSNFSKLNPTITLQIENLILFLISKFPPNEIELVWQRVSTKRKYKKKKTVKKANNNETSFKMQDVESSVETPNGFLEQTIEQIPNSNEATINGDHNHDSWLFKGVYSIYLFKMYYKNRVGLFNKLVYCKVVCEQHFDLNHGSIWQISRTG